MDKSIIISFVFLLIVLVLIIVALIRAGRVAKKYDERQILARYFAYKVSFFTLISYCFVCGVLSIFKIVWIEFALQIFLGVVLSLTVFAVICIAKDAYLDFTGERKWRYIVNAYSMAAIYTVSVLMKTFDEKFDGDFLGLLPFIVGSVCFLTVAVTATVKAVVSERSSD